MARSIPDAIRELSLSFPHAEQVLSHGKPGYAVRGKFFAYYTVNHHGDGRVALLVNAPAGVQAACVKAEPRHYIGYRPTSVRPAGSRWMPASASTRPSYRLSRSRATGISQRNACSRAWESDVQRRQCP
jgi:hypothetical protein